MAQEAIAAPDPTTVDSAEVARFAALAADWWNPDGKFKPLHKLNPLRRRHCGPSPSCV